MPDEVIEVFPVVTSVVNVLKGVKGDPGNDGVDGEDGATGPQGPTGATGAAAPSDFRNSTRSAGVYSIHRMDAGSGSGLGSGGVCASLAYCRTAGTYTQIRTYVSSAGTGVTGFKLGVWASDGSSLLAESSSLAGSLVTNTWVTASLNNSLIMTLDQRVFLGVATTFTGTAPSARAFMPPNVAIWPTADTAYGLLPYRGRNTGTWAGSTNALPSTISTGAGNGALPLIELVL